MDNEVTEERDPSADEVADAGMEAVNLMFGGSPGPQLPLGVCVFCLQQARVNEAVALVSGSSVCVAHAADPT